MDAKPRFELGCLMASRRTANGTTPHPIELRLTLMSYVAHYWARPHPVYLRRNLLSYTVPYWSMPHHWATPHLTKLRSTLLSYAALFRLLYILWSGRFFHLLFIFLLGFWIFYFCDSSLEIHYIIIYHLWLISHLMFFLLVIIRQAFYSFTYVSIVLSWRGFFEYSLNLSSRFPRFLCSVPRSVPWCS
jgi:hypothetical protein